MLVSASNFENKKLKQIRFKMNIKSVAIIIYSLAATAIVSSIYASISESFKVEAEYINGILATSGILFGFWILFLQRALESPAKEIKSKELLGTSLFLSFSVRAKSSRRIRNFHERQSRRLQQDRKR